MASVLFAVVLANVLIYGALAALAVRTATTDPSPRIRVLSWGFAAVCGAFVLGGLTRLALLAVRHGWLGGTVGDFLVSGWAMMQSVAALALGIGGIVFVRRVATPLRRADRIADALSDRVPSEMAIAELGLTARELEVLRVIASGTISDKDIADALFISPHTAGTHVKNIMRKAGVRNRRDLTFLALSEPD